MIDEKYEPRFPVVNFGNGAQAKAKRIIPNILTDSGIIVTEIHFAPTPHMIDYYNFRGNDFNKEGLIVERYPQIGIIVPEPKRGTMIRSLFVLSDYEGRKTPLSDRFPDTKLIQRFQVEKRILTAKIAALENDIHIIMTRPGEYIKRAARRIKAAREAAGDIVMPGFSPEQPGMPQIPQNVNEGE